MCVLKICLYCKKKFKAERNAREYCGRKCFGLSSRLTGPCTSCGVKHAIKRPTGYEAWYNHPKTGKTICSRCYGKIPRKRVCVNCGPVSCTRWHSNEKGRICHSCAEKKRRKDTKLKVFTHYCNGKPVCNEKDCDVDDVDMLALDHINDDGAFHRKEIGVKNGFHIYEWAIKNNYPKIFQVLCWNHNIKKQMIKLRS
jgi:hypothetical protein